MHPAPRLAPGTVVLPRDACSLQVGLDPTRAVRLPRDPDVLADLGALADPRTRRRRGPSAATLGPLERAGLLGPRHLPRARLAPGTRVPDGLSDRLARAGVRLDGEAPTVLVAAVGEPDRELLDPLVRTSTPHLVARIVDGAALVGPYVVPGRTACLRCLDRHRADADPTWPGLLALHLSSPGPPPRDDVPALTTLLAGWIAADLGAAAVGRTPATLGATVRLPLALHDLEATSWPAHPDCGCGWDHRADRPLLGAEVTMGP